MHNVYLLPLFFSFVRSRVKSCRYQEKKVGIHGLFPGAIVITGTDADSPSSGTVVWISYDPSTVDLLCF